MIRSWVHWISVMRHRFRLPRLGKRLVPLGTAAAPVAVIVAGVYGASSASRANVAQATPVAPPVADSQSGAPQTVRLADAQVNSIKVGTTVDHDLSIQREAIGSIESTKT
jgi:negative regulator of sigma E activity